VIVFSVHGTVLASSTQSPHRSTTISSSMLTADLFSRLELGHE
jgi:hypothetical protein